MNETQHQTQQSEDLIRLIQQLVGARNNAESLRIVVQHPEILADEAVRVLEHASEVARSKGELSAFHILEATCTFLQRFRTVGVKLAFTENQINETGTTKEIVESGDYTRGKALFELFQISDEATYEETYRDIVRRNPELMTDDADRQLVTNIAQIIVSGGEQADSIIEKLKYHRRILSRCRRLGIDNAFRPTSTLEMLYDRADGAPDQISLIDSLPGNIKTELDNLFSLRDLMDMSIREPSVGNLLQQLEFDNLRNWVIIAAVWELVSAQNPVSAIEIIGENPELLSDDTQVFFDAVLDDAAKPGMAQFTWARNLILRCREVGIDAAMQEVLAIQSLEELVVPEEFAHLLQGDNPDQRIVSLWDYVRKNPEWLDDLERNNPLMTALFALADLALQPVTLRLLIEIVNRHPLMLTKRFDDEFMAGFHFAASNPLPPGITEEHRQFLTDQSQGLISFVRRLRGLGLNSERLSNIAEYVSSDAFDEGTVEHLDMKQPKNRLTVSSIALIGSPIPALACQVMDARLTLEEAIGLTQDAVTEMDDDVVVHQNSHIRTLLEDRAGNLHPTYFLAELNHAAACSRDNYTLVAETAATLDRCAEALMSNEQSIQERSRLMERRLSAGHIAVDAWKRLGNGPRYAEALCSLADIYLASPVGNRISNCKQAIAYLHETEDLIKESASPSDRAGLLYNLGVAYSQMGRRSDEDSDTYLEEAISCFQQAQEYLDLETDVELYLAVQNALGTTYSSFRHAQSEYLQRGIVCYQNILRVCTPPSHVETRVMALLNLGASLPKLLTGGHQGNLQLAKAYLEEAIHLCTVYSFPTARRNQGSAWMNLAMVHMALEEGDRAFNLHQAINFVKSAVKALAAESTSWDGAATQNHLGSLYAELANVENDPGHLDEAEAYLRNAADSFARLRATREHIEALNNLASLYRTRATMKVGTQIENLENAISMLDGALTLSDPDRHIEQIATTGWNLGNIWFDFASSLRDPWSRASTAYLAALSAREKLYRSEGTFESRQVHLRHVAYLAKRAAFSFARLGKFSAAVEAYEVSRARTLAMALSLDNALLDKATHEDREDFKSRRLEVKRLEAEDREQIHSGMQLQDTASAKIDISARLRTARRELDQVIDRIRSYLPDFMPVVPRFSDVAAIPDIEHPIVYLASETQGGLALIVSHGIETLTNEHVVWLNEFTQMAVNKLVGLERQLNPRGYLRAQMGETSMENVLDYVLPALGYHLNELIERLRSLGYERCVFLPLGLLSLLPLHAAQLPNGRYVCQDLELTYTPSARILQYARRRLAADPQQRLFAVGDPRHRSSSPALFAQIEAEQIANLFAQDKRHTLYGGEATHDSVSAVISGSTYIHFSCHGRYDPNAPLLSSLQLAGTEELTLSNILNDMNLAGSRLAVLSACQTAISDFSRVPDEVIGLPAGFLQAGVPGIIGSLWPVNDLSTMLLMVKFYEAHLRDGLAPAAALRKAQLWLRDVTNAELSELFAKYKLTATDRPDSTRMAYETASERFREHTLRDPNEKPYAHPYFWAPFVFYGV